MKVKVLFCRRRSRNDAIACRAKAAGKEISCARLWRHRGNNKATLHCVYSRAVKQTKTRGPQLQSPETKLTYSFSSIISPVLLSYWEEEVSFGSRRSIFCRLQRESNHAVLRERLAFARRILGENGRRLGEAKNPRMSPINKLQPYRQVILFF